MLVAEQLFLLLRRDDGKAESAFAQNDYGLSGAVLTDLLLGEHIALNDDKDPRVTVTTAESVGDPVLDAALERVRAKEGTKLSGLVTDGRLNPRDRIADSLAADGVIAIEPKKAFGLIGARYPVRDPRPEQGLRERLRAVLSGASATPGEAALLALLKGLGVSGKVLDEEKGLLSKHDLNRRIDEVASGDVIGQAVAKAIEAMTAAIVVITAGAAAASSSS
ncbi:GPP34 family phosphoprotein [Nostocoides sp. F2B08]|uniref:GOLPH3/VPS74 family protein n=1 Tax=Nostocoides sp. F2B08 TaxID=2653936 RepID=UPI00186AC289|nr:GPP34 family phosphoprotein [Tetrasphaera sp. F2B08]